MFSPCNSQELVGNINAFYCVCNSCPTCALSVSLGDVCLSSPCFMQKITPVFFVILGGQWLLCALASPYRPLFFFTERRLVTVCFTSGASQRNVHAFLFEGTLTSVLRHGKFAVLEMIEHQTICKFHNFAFCHKNYFGV